MTPTLDDVYGSLHSDSAVAAPDAAKAAIPDAMRNAVQQVAAAAHATNRPIVVVSACLCGIRCRFDGDHRDNPAIVRVIERKFVVPLCPEVLGGMSVPRLPLHFTSADKVVDEAGQDRSQQLEQGAARAFELLQNLGATQAILKERSPSCGVRQVHGPQGVQAGAGIFARMLRAAGVTLFTEEDANELL